MLLPSGVYPFRAMLAPAYAREWPAWRERGTPQRATASPPRRWVSLTLPAVAGALACAESPRFGSRAGPPTPPTSCRLPLRAGAVAGAQKPQKAQEERVFSFSLFPRKNTLLGPRCGAAKRQAAAVMHPELLSWGALACRWPHAQVLGMGKQP